MRFPRIHPIRHARRNAVRSPTVTVATRGDFIKMRIEQLRQFRQLRGSIRTTKPIPVEEPYGNGASPYQRIPQTTNADIKAIVRAWERAYRTYGLRDSRLGGTHNEAFEQTHRRRWEHTKRRIRQLTRARPDSDKFVPPILRAANGPRPARPHELDCNRCTLAQRLTIACCGCRPSSRAL